MTGGHNRISVSSEQCGGQPCIRGLRIRVVDVLDLLAHGLTPEQVVVELPDLEPDDIPACLHFASRCLGHSGQRLPSILVADADIQLRLSIQFALLSQVTSELRSVSADLDANRRIIRMRFVFARPPSDSERDAASVAATLIISDYSEGWRIDEEYLIVPPGERPPHLRLLTYERCEDAWVGPDR